MQREIKVQTTAVICRKKQTDCCHQCNTVGGDAADDNADVDADDDSDRTDG